MVVAKVGKKVEISGCRTDNLSENADGVRLARVMHNQIVPDGSPKDRQKSNENIKNN